MEIKKGTPVSPGVAIGPAFVLEREGARIPRKFVMPEEVEREIERFEKALAAARDDIEQLIERLRGKFEGGYDVADIFRVHVTILNDPHLCERVAQLIRLRNFTPEYAVSHVLRQYTRPFERTSDPYMAQRQLDFADIEQRLLRHLLGERREDLAHLTEPVIVVAKDLTPSQTVSLDRSKVLAFVTDTGGRTSHTAILSRALEIPAVVGVTGFSAEVSGGDILVVDGTHGVVIISPDEQTIRQYEERGRQIQRFESRLDEEVRDLPAVTLDGCKVEILANIEFPREVSLALKYGAHGIGLYRTEFLFHQYNLPPDESAHFEAYQEAVRLLGDRPLVIRLLDLGGDKFPFGVKEQNPFLGLRSIRLLLQNQEMFRAQVRAVLRVSLLGNVRFMFPLITNLAELREAKKLVREVMAELDREGKAYFQQIPIGIMIEVPSAAIMADHLAKEADFFSIGTNDLIQYALAVDRNNTNVAHLFSPADPAVLRLIRTTIKAGEARGIPVAVCGEMAGEPLYTILLLGMGLREFSVAPKVIPEIKKIIRSVTLVEAEQVAEEVAALDSADTIVRFLEEKLRKVLPEAF